jgi:hypothetical protein
MADAFKEWLEEKNRMDQEIFDKNDELAKKDATIKSLTGKQLEMAEGMKKMQKIKDVIDDMQS